MNELTNKLKYLVLLACLPFLSSGQIDSLTAVVFDQLLFNISQLPQTKANSRLILKPFSPQQFAEEYKKLDSELFPVPLKNAEEFYAQLFALPKQQQEKLAYWFGDDVGFISNEIGRNSLSPELKYLPAALSGMNVNAVGPERRAGIWQLAHFQGIMHGLQVGRMVDERFDVEKASVAALAEIKQNTIIFGSGERAILAYLAGKVKLQNILAVSGEDASISIILEQLPANVMATVAAFQAMSVFLYSIDFTSNEIAANHEKVIIDREMHFQQLATVLNVPVNEIRKLNPAFRFSIVPGDKKYALKLPAGKKDDFAIYRDSIYSSYDSAYFEVVAQKIEYPPAPTRQYVGEKVKDLEIEGKTKLKYMIKTGDVLGFIAEDFDVRVADLKYWNNIYNERRIQAGQTIDIFVDDDKAEYYQKLAGSGNATVQTQKEEGTFTAAVPNYVVPETAKKIEHVVKSGESPYVIAQKYEGVTPEAILQWNGISDARKIQIGQKLTIYLTQ